eukprot:Hpha_TRINITY_DN12804_c0_g1::TRINITY_DN12804_c0_g1_i1::g.24148::m.24148
MAGTGIGVMLRKIFTRMSECSIHPSDTENDANIKRTATPVACLFLFVFPWLVVQWVAESEKSLFPLVAALIYNAAVLWYLGGAFSRCLPFGLVLDVGIPLFTVGILANDFGAVSAGNSRMVSMVVVALDFALLYERDHIPPYLICMTIAYLILERIEAVTTMGLYEASDIEVVDLCNCANPPCGVSPAEGLKGLFIFMMVFMVDFFLTRMFASGLRTQLKRMNASVGIAAIIAGKLAQYDVEGAEAALSETTHAEDLDLPKEMAESFRQLLYNLKSYRPYLPQSCLLPMESSSEESPPLENSGREPLAMPPRVILRSFSQIGGIPAPGSAQSFQSFGSPRLGAHPSSPGPSRADSGPSPRSFASPPQLFTVLAVSSDPDTPLSTPPRSLPKQRSGSDGDPELGGLGVVGSLSTAPQTQELHSHWGHQSLSRSRSLKFKPKKSRVSLACANRIGYLVASGGFESPAHQDWMANDVEQWCHVVLPAKGVVDLISGDKRYASFNARHTCSGHSRAAISVLWGRGDSGDDWGERGARTRWTGAVVTGSAVGGDFGSSTMLRFMVLGPVASSLHPLERLAAKWRIHVLIDEEAQGSAFDTWEGLLLGAVMYEKRTPKAIYIYTVTAPRRPMGAIDAEEGGYHEWMYSLAEIPDGANTQRNDDTAARIKAEMEAAYRHPLQTPMSAELASPPGVVWDLADVGITPWATQGHSEGGTGGMESNGARGRSGQGSITLTTSRGACSDSEATINGSK